MRSLPVIALACAGMAACQRGTPGIPATTGPIEIDGEWHEPDWSQRARREILLAEDGSPARPSSELRLLHDAENLYVGLYAADEDLRSETDTFVVTIGAVTLQVHPTGVLSPPLPWARVAADHDGTLDDPHDDDEEWVIELALPLAQLRVPPGGRADVKVSRCDTTKSAERRCGAWAGSFTLE